MRCKYCNEDMGNPSGPCSNLNYGHEAKVEVITEKSLGQIAFEAAHEDWEGPPITWREVVTKKSWERAAQAVAEKLTLAMHTLKAQVEEQKDIYRAEGAAEERERLAANWPDMIRGSETNMTQGEIIAEWLRAGGDPENWDARKP